MLPTEPEAWIKVGTALTNGETHLSVMVTNGTSGWFARAVS